MTVTIEKIEEAEKQTNILLRQEKQMQRDFMADGTLQPAEKKQLAAIDGKIAKLKGIVAALRKELEETKRAFDARKADLARLEAQAAELRDWGHAEAGAMEAAVAGIAAFPPQQRWKDATAALEKAMAAMAPVYKDYTTQLAAKGEYELLRADLDARLDAAAAAEPPVDQIARALSPVQGNMAAIDATVAKLDYVEGLALVRAGLGQMDVIEEAIRLVQDQKALFDSQWAALRPRLDEVAACEFPDLAPMQDDLLALRDRIAAAADAHDYPTAFAELGDAQKKHATYMAAYAAAVDARTQYEARIGGVQAELSEFSTCEFPALTGQQTDLLAVADAMEAAAAAGSHEAAIVEMDRLVPLIAAYRTALEEARLGRAFEELLARLSPRIDGVAVCNFGPLLAQSEAILNDRTAAENAAAGGDYAGAIRTLEGVEPQLDRYDADLAAQEAAQADYTPRVDGVLDRYDALARCDYPQLDAPREKATTLRDAMVAAAGERDFVMALEKLDALEAEIGFVEETLADLDARRAEYDMRLPGLITRFDASMVSDYAELEDERAALQTARREMEAGAAALDYVVALDRLNLVERLLNDLDAQVGNLDAIRKQYEDLLARIQPQLDAVDGCSHAELKVKKDAIVALRSAMKAAADATDFATALQKANALVAPLNAFTELEKLLEEYLRRLKVVEPRIGTVRGFAYKSLEKTKKEIDTLFTDMKAKAAAAELAEALDKMTTLEKLVTDAIARNEELKKQEAVYKKLHADMQPKIDLVKKNKIEDAQGAADAVTKAHDEMVKLSDEHEYEKAVTKADEVRGLIDTYLDKVRESDDAKLAFETLRDVANESHAGAVKKVGEYPTLKDDLKPVDAAKSAMDTAARAAEGTGDWVPARDKAQALIDAVGTFDEAWQKETEREATIRAEAQTQIDRFDALPEDARDKAKDDWKDAGTYVGRIRDALTEKDLDRAKDQTAELKEALDKITDALKTQAEHKAEYEGRLSGIDRDMAALRVTPFKDVLSEEMGAAEKAYAEMTAMAGHEDYEGAVKAAPAVDTAIGAFQTAETAIKMDQVRFEERMAGLADLSAKALAVTEVSLMGKVMVVRTLHVQAEAQGKAHDYKAALETAAKLRTLIDEVLAAAEKIEESRKEQEGEKTKAGEVLDFIQETVLEELLEKIPGPAGKAARKLNKGIGVVRDGLDAAENIYDAAGNLIDGNYDGALDKLKDAGDSAWDTAKGVAGLTPAGQIYEEAMDTVEDVKKIADTIKDLAAD